jgi:hypothetical protein
VTVIISPGTKALQVSAGFIKTDSLSGLYRNYMLPFIRKFDRSFRHFACRPKGRPFVPQALTVYQPKLQYRGTAINLNHSRTTG